MATHSSVLVWRIPGIGKPGGLPSTGVAQSRTRLKRLSSRRVSLTINGEHMFFKEKISRENMLSEFKKENSKITQWKKKYIFPDVLKI